MAKWFNDTLSITSENVISNIYITAETREEAKKIIIERFNGRLDPFEFKEM